MPKLPPHNPFKPLPGYTVQGHDGESNGWRVVVSSSITIAIAFLAVVTRMFVKARIVKATNWEDYLILMALVFALARTTMFIILVQHHQLGQHVWDVDVLNINTIYVWTKAIWVLYLIAVFCAKTSILVFYRRLFGINKSFRILCYTVIAVVAIYCLLSALLNIFQCRPLIAGWEFFTKGKCLSLIQITRATGYLNIITDFIIVVMPMPLIWKLQLRTIKMIGVILTFATGFVVVAMAIIRQVQVVSHPNVGDVARMEMERELWQNVELNIGIVCACLPFFGALSRKIPGKDYFRQKYDSMQSLLRGSRSRSVSGKLSGQSSSKANLESSEYGKSLSIVKTQQTDVESATRSNRDRV